MTNIKTELRNPSTPAPRALWLTLWYGDGSPNAAAWEDLAGPPGAAAGDSHPTREGDRSHPSAPAVEAVDDAADVVLIAPPSLVASARARGPLPDALARWFSPGTIAASAHRNLDGRARGAAYSATHTAPGGASVLGATRPVTTAAAAGSGALVLYRSGGAWRPGIVQ